MKQQVCSNLQKPSMNSIICDNFGILLCGIAISKYQGQCILNIGSTQLQNKTPFAQTYEYNYTQFYPNENSYFFASLP